MFGKSTFLQWEMIALFGYTHICFNLVEERLKCKINLFQFKKKIEKSHPVIQLQINGHKACQV